MLVILAPNDYDAWLDPKNTDIVCKHGGSIRSITFRTDHDLNRVGGLLESHGLPSARPCFEVLLR